MTVLFLSCVPAQLPHFSHMTTKPTLKSETDPLCTWVSSTSICSCANETHTSSTISGCSTAVAHLVLALVVRALPGSRFMVKLNAPSYPVPNLPYGAEAFAVSVWVAVKVDPVVELDGLENRQ